MSGFIWTTKDGLRIDPRFMTVQHLINAVTWLATEAHKPEDELDGHTAWEWLQHLSTLIINKKLIDDQIKDSKIKDAWGKELAVGMEVYAIHYSTLKMVKAKITSHAVKEFGDTVFRLSNPIRREAYASGLIWSGHEGAEGFANKYNEEISK